MNTGQMLMVMGAFVLLSTLSLSINRALLDSDQVMVEARAGVLAVSVCQGQVEDLVSGPFDSLAVGTRMDTVSTAFSAFACSTNVGYVDASAPDSVVAGPTDLKRVSVTVSSPWMGETVSLRGLSGKYR